jgi:hypothetical protein
MMRRIRTSLLGYDVAMPARAPEPEIIPPGQPIPRLSDAALDRLASMLDDQFRVPGTSLRFGLDPIIGLVPGIGDVITGLAALLFVYAAWERGLPRVTIARMVTNIAVDTLGGTLPIFGDLFDAYWKSNRMNYNLLLRQRRIPRAQQTGRDWLFFLVLAVIVAALVILPLAVMVWIVHLLRR